jgi:hypothetical protein
MADINWDPPALVFMFDGGLYCPDCASGIERDLIGQGLAMCQGSDDSTIWPVAFSSTHFGETDSPDHCETCQRFLGRRLTDDGVAYVQQSAVDDLDQHGAIGDVVQGWLDYYGIDLESIDGYYGVDGIDLASAVGIESETEGK